MVPSLPTTQRYETLPLTGRYACPFPDCTQHQDAEKPRGFQCKPTLVKHLRDQHGHELSSIPLTYLKSSKLHVCHQCVKSSLHSSPKEFNKHCETHITYRTQDNYTIISKHLYTETIETVNNNHWQEALKWLAKYNPEPPPFRTSLLPSINYQLEEMLLDLLTDIIHTTNELKKPPRKSNANKPSFESDVAAGQLIYIYEQLILAPTIKEKGGPSLTQLIKRRIRLFRSGQLEKLHEEARRVTTAPQPQQYNNATPNPDLQKKSAQRSADEDDFRTATNRLLRSTPIAPNTPENIDICVKLHPNRYEYEPTFPDRPQTRSQVATNPICLTPEETVQRIRNLPKGKALGIQGDSLDLFIKLVRKRIPPQTNLKTLPKTSIAHSLATFFSNIANANYGDRERKYMNTIYFVAFHKDVNNPKKLRPIGVPSAIRRITSNLLIHKNKYDFAAHLLPYNYAVGVPGGISTVVNTLRVGVDKYITTPQAEGRIPTRALISLDIKNMFNAISRHKLREIIAHDFPHLQNITDSLYKDHHTAMYKDHNNKWSSFTVEEGFTQGCPFSPLFAGLVLTNILEKINNELLQRASKRIQENNKGDDELGGQPLIMAYVDDTNCLIPLQDVLFFLKRFEHYGVPLGAIMNTDKTRIMTSTSGESILSKLSNNNEHTLAQELREAISKYSTQNSKMHEEVNGLRVLGSPIGSIAFQQQFIKDYFKKAKEDATNLLKGLDDDQTILQLYRQCTSQRINHLFPSDVHAFANTSLCQPDNWHKWDSPTARAFDRLNEEVITAITQKEKLKEHSIYLTNLETKYGGIGITSPRLKAIPAFILNMKGTINTIQNGVFLGKNRERYTLPEAFTTLFNNTATNPSPSLQLFHKYATHISQLCTTTTTTQNNQIKEFISNTPLHKCHDIINKEIKHRLRTDIINSLEDDSKHNVDEILDGKLGQGLLDLPRTNENNRQGNRLFRFNLLRTLRINLWESEQQLKCPKCNQNFDKKGDHLYQCAVIGKKTNTIMHNKWRDSWQNQMNTLMPLIHLTDRRPKKEQQNLIKSLKGTTVRPFDTHINLPLISKDSHFRTKLQKIGFDIVLCNSDTCPSPSRGPDAKSKNIITSLIEAEKKKFQRGNSISSSKTNTQTGITLSGDEIMGELYNSKMQLIPFAISPLGLFGPTINALLYGIDPPEQQNMHNIDPNKFPNASKMAKRSIASDTPFNILQQANAIHRANHPNQFYGHSYKCPDPHTYFTQQFGRNVCFANGTAGLTAITLLGEGPTSKSPINNSCLDDTSFYTTNCTDTTAFRQLSRNDESSYFSESATATTDALNSNNNSPTT